MYFTKTTAITASLALVAPGLAQLYPPGGPGEIKVTISGDEDFTGCLDANAQWTLSDCATVYGNGQGGIGSDNGFFILDNTKTIVGNGHTWSTAWIGTHEDQGRNATNLEANIDVQNIPEGGIEWYAAGLPDGESTAAINAELGDNTETITLTFVSTYVDA